MKKIPLTQNQFAIVDDEDYEHLMQNKWHAILGTAGYYARRAIKRNGKHYNLLMSRAILGIINSSLIVDHKNRNTLDNRKENLRVCTNAENICNRKASRSSTSKYLGVSFLTKRKKWEAQIGKNGKKYHLGQFNTEQDAAKAYDTAAKIYHGEYANLNFK